MSRKAKKIYLFDPIYGYKRQIDLDKFGKVIGQQKTNLYRYLRDRRKVKGLNDYLIDDTFTKAEIQELREKEELKGEIWRDLRRNPQRYRISNYGRIYDLRYKKLVQCWYTNGCIKSRARDTEGKEIKFPVAREVYKEFVEYNITKKDYIMKHDKGGNLHVSNLFKGTSKEWQSYVDSPKKKNIIRIDPHTKQQEYYEGVRIAARENFISFACISDCLRGKKKTAGGYYWKYDENLNFYI